MDINDFSHLVEIQSLDRQIKKHLDKIEEEKERLNQLEKMRHKRADEKESLTDLLNTQSAKLREAERELHEWETKLEKAKAGETLATNEKEAQAFANEIAKGEEEVGKRQEDVFHLMEEVEAIEGKIAEAQSFLEGSLDTLAEIKREVDSIEAIELKEIGHYDERIESLLEQVPAGLKDTFIKVRQKHRFRQPLARIQNRSCEKCRFVVDGQKSSRVEAAQTPEICDQCERLLIPLQA